MNCKRNSMSCFVCGTPYQLLGAISIVQEYEIDADLYVLDLFKGCQKVVERLRGYNIFREIVLVDYKRFSSLNFFVLLYQDLNFKKICDSILLQDVSYDYYYSSTRAHFKLLMLYQLRKKNPKIKCIYYEDGTGAYSFDSYPSSSLVKNNKYRTILEFVLKQNSMKRDQTSIMVTSPELIDLPSKWSYVELLKMPHFLFTKKNVEIVNSIFDISFDDQINERVIMFDSYRVKESVLQSNLSLFTSCIKIAYDLLGEKNCILKPHPLSTSKVKENIKLFQLDGVPMEAIYASMNNLDSRILIGNMSTALCSPKMMFGKEPYVISVHRIVMPDDKGQEFIFNKMRSMYSKKEKFMAPSTLHEFEGIIRGLD